MIYQGKSLSAQLLEDGIVELKFDAQGSVNKFDQATFVEYKAVVTAINNCSDAKGVMVTSGKSTFRTSIFSLPESFTKWISPLIIKGILSARTK